jgi:hypothetical protein
MKNQYGSAERDAVPVLERRALNRPFVEQRLVARSRRQIHEDEFLVRRALDERMVAMDGFMLERNVIVAVPPDTQDLTLEGHRHSVRPFANANPRLVTPPRWRGCGEGGLPTERRPAPCGSADREQPGEQGQCPRESKPHHHHRRSPIGFGDLAARAPRRIHHALVRRLYAELQNRTG